jgi:molybdenum cofactor guanylyltransferase
VTRAATAWCSPAAARPAWVATRRLLAWHGQPALERACELLAACTDRAFVSLRPEQAGDPLRSALPHIVDGATGQGPIAGIAAAQAARPEAAWLVLACDLPFVDAGTLANLLERRDAAEPRDGLPQRARRPARAAVRDLGAGQPRPLLAFIRAGRHCPRKFLISFGATLIDLPDPLALDNVNTPDELEAARRAACGSRSRLMASVRIQYYALLREQAGRSGEAVDAAGDAAATVRHARGATRLHAAARPAQGRGERRVRRLVAPARRRRRGGVHPAGGRRMSAFAFSRRARAGASRTALADPACGGFVSFEGWVRNDNEGRSVERLDYEAFELAIREGERIIGRRSSASACARPAACTASASLESARWRSGSASRVVTGQRPLPPAATSSTRSSTGYRSGRRNTTRTAIRAG